MMLNIEIDTDKELRLTDRALLRALLGDEPTQQPSGHERTPTPRRIQDQILNATTPPGSQPALSLAKLPVSQQPGVSTTESTPEDPDEHA